MVFQKVEGAVAVALAFVFDRRVNGKSSNMSSHSSDSKEVLVNLLGHSHSVVIKYQQQVCKLLMLIVIMFV